MRSTPKVLIHASIDFELRQKLETIGEPYGPLVNRLLRDHFNLNTVSGSQKVKAALDAAQRDFSVTSLKMRELERQLESALVMEKKAVEEATMALEEKERKKVACVVCDVTIHPQSPKVLVRAGEFKGRFVCGGLSGGCFVGARERHKEWF